MTALLVGLSSYVAAGILSLLFTRYRFRFSLLGWAGATAGASIALSSLLGSGSLVVTLGRWGVLGIEIVIDQTTLLFAGLVVLLNFFTLIYLRGEKKGAFYCLYNFLLASTFSIAFAHDLFNLYVAIEFMSLVSILLIGYERKAYQIYAGAKYLLISSLAMSLYLIGLGLIYRSGGSLGIQNLTMKFEGARTFCPHLGLCLMIAGLAVKGGVFLFSMWLPDAHSYSETVVSALLSGMAIKSGLVGMIRVLEVTDWGSLLLVLGAITGIAGVSFAATAHKPKRILAYHTISQVGYILLGIGSGTAIGVAAAALHIFFHGLFKGLLFISVGDAGVGVDSIYRAKSLSLPLANKIGLAVGSLSIMAVPPFNGFFSKSLLLEHASRNWVWFVMLMMGFGTVFSFLKLNWSLLIKAGTEKSGKSDLPIGLFALAVAVSGPVTWFVVGTGAFRQLFLPQHLIVAFSVIGAAGLVLASLSDQLKEVNPRTFPFDLDNSLISLFTGFLIIALLLFRL